MVENQREIIMAGTVRFLVRDYRSTSGNMKYSDKRFLIFRVFSTKPFLAPKYAKYERLSKRLEINDL